MSNNTSRKEKYRVYDFSNPADVMASASLFESLEEENKNFEHVSDDEDYEDPALYELFKGTQMAKYFKKQKTSHDAESSVGDIGGDDLDNASIDGVSVGDDWDVSPDAGDDLANGDDQAEEVQGQYRQRQSTLFSAWKESMEKFVEGYLSFLGNTTDKPSTKEEEASASIPCGCPSAYRMSKKINLFFWHCKSFECLTLFSKLIYFSCSCSIATRL